MRKNEKVHEGYKGVVGWSPRLPQPFLNVSGGGHVLFPTFAYTFPCKDGNHGHRLATCQVKGKEFVRRAVDL